jgi:hypothetical protein
MFAPGHSPFGHALDTRTHAHPRTRAFSTRGAPYGGEAQQLVSVKGFRFLCQNLRHLQLPLEGPSEELRVV